MSKIRAKDTKPEIALRKALWNLGYRYRIDVKNLPGKPDIVFRLKKVAVFVDGEFWHGYKWKEKKKKIKANRNYWIPKIEKNIGRDKKNTKALQKDEWKVFRFWEHEIKKELDECVKVIVKVL